MRAGMACMSMALVLHAGTALAECPTGFGNGLRFETSDKRYSREYRAGVTASGQPLLHATVRDTRPQTALIFAYSEMTYMDGLLRRSVDVPVRFGMDVDSLAPPLSWATLAATGTSQADGTMWIIPMGETERVDIARERRTLRVLEQSRQSFGECAYDVWHISMTDEIIEQLLEPERSLPEAEVWSGWYAPALGVMLARELEDIEDQSRYILAYDSVTALD